MLQDIVTLFGKILQAQGVLPGPGLLVLAEDQKAEVVREPDPADEDDLELRQRPTGRGILQVVESEAAAAFCSQVLSEDIR